MDLRESGFKSECNYNFNIKSYLDIDLNVIDYKFNLFSDHDHNKQMFKHVVTSDLILFFRLSGCRHLCFATSSLVLL